MTENEKKVITELIAAANAMDSAIDRLNESVYDCPSYLTQAQAAYRKRKERVVRVLDFLTS